MFSEVSIEDMEEDLTDSVLCFFDDYRWNRNGNSQDFPSVRSKEDWINLFVLYLQNDNRIVL